MDLTGIGSLADLAKRLTDVFLPDKAQQEKDAAAYKIQQLIADSDAFKAQAGIVQQEVASSNWLASSWRPITMLIFVALIVARWFGWTAPNLQPEEYIKLWDIVQLGLGGYVIGRSAEKIVPTIASAIRAGKQ
jgi:hypothetical protein